MPVQEFECQIARGQIGRYLNGEGLSNEGLRQLGIHVAECTECKTFLDHRKAILQGMLGEAPMPTQQPAHAVIDVNPSEALIAQIRARSGEVEPEPEPVAVQKPTKPLITKPVMYCGALAVLLVAMTYISRNPTGFLGPNAAAAVSTKSTVAANTSAETKPAEEVKPAPDATPVADPKAAVTPPVTPKVETADPAKDVKPTDSKVADKTIPAPEASKPAIDPTAKETVSPLKVDAPPVKKPAVKPAAKPHRWHPKAATHRRSGIFNLKPGTSAIHVYTHPIQ